MKLFGKKAKNQFAPKSISFADDRRKSSRKWIWITTFFILITISVVGWQLVQSQLFTIEEVVVVQLVGVKPNVVPNDQMQRLASGMRGESLLFLNEKEIIDDWKSRMPTVESLYVEKKYPSSIEISYVPRVAFSQLVSPQESFLVDRDGYIFAKTKVVDFLPKVMIEQSDVAIGKTTSARGVILAQHLIEGLRNANPRLVSVLFKDGVLEITMTSDPKLLISQDKAAMPTLLEIETLFAKFVQDEKFPKEVDMRYDRPVLRY